MDDNNRLLHSGNSAPTDNTARDTQHTPSLYSPLTEKDHRIIYLLIDNNELTEQLQNDIEKFGYETRLIESNTESPEAFELDLNSALLCDLVYSSCQSVTTAKELNLPVIHLSSEDTIETRLKSVREMGSYFLPYNCDISKLVSTIDRATTPHLNQSYRVLIIDDDDILATLNQLTLKRAGMDAKVIHNPLETLEHLESFKPDLILMDVFMPQCSGTELARIIRQEEKYAGIPIVFLSTESDKEEKMTAMEFGGDDFLTKPVSPERLVSSVSTRAKRAVDANTVAKKLEALANELKGKTIELDNALISARSSEALKSKLIAIVSHEIRTPINGMIGILERLLESPLNQTQKEQAEIILSSTESLLRILNDTLDFSKLEAGKMILEKTDFSLSKLTKEVQQLFYDTAIKKGIIIYTTIDDSIPEIISGDPLRLKQILINLTNNAIKFTEKGSIRISIKLREQSDDKLLLKFEVKDSGIGMSASQQEKIFKEYAQASDSTSRTHGGTGLGLSICEKLVKMMNGKIGVKSRTEIGSTFWFTAEFHKCSQVNSKNLHTSDENEDTININIKEPRFLIVDDSKVNLMVISSHLSKLGIAFETAMDGEEAVKMFKNNNYHMIFMDCHMPKLDGYQAAGMIRAHEREYSLTRTPIVAITGNTLESDIVKCLDAGMDYHLAKPIRKESLVKILKQRLEQPQ